MLLQLATATRSIAMFPARSNPTKANAIPPPPSSPLLPPPPPPSPPSPPPPSAASVSVLGIGFRAQPDGPPPSVPLRSSSSLRHLLLLLLLLLHLFLISPPHTHLALQFPSKGSLSPQPYDSPTKLWLLLPPLNFKVCPQVAPNTSTLPSRSTRQARSNPPSVAFPHPRCSREFRKPLNVSDCTSCKFRRFGIRHLLVVCWAHCIMLADLLSVAVHI